MTFYDNAVPKIAEVVNIANGGRSSLLAQGLELNQLMCLTAPDENGLQGTINLTWDGGQNRWQVSIG